jgi:predicted DCC family thiol-disulfide oxidoreductase YuxK
MNSIPQVRNQTKPILLFNDECGVCRRIAHWVQKSAPDKSGEASIIEQPIGDDPEALRLLNPDLDIWDAYETIHLLMPDGSMKLGGEAVAEVLRNLPSTKWLARGFALNILGFRPCQMVLNMAYGILAEVRPLLGCESCGRPHSWMKPIAWTITRAKAIFGERRHPSPTPHFTSVLPKGRRLRPTEGERLPQAVHF